MFRILVCLIKFIFRHCTGFLLTMKYNLNYFILFVDDYCESYPACPGRCRDSCLPGEEASSTSIENWGCQNSFYTVDYCCKGKGELPSTDIETSSSSTNLPNHPAWKAFDGSLSTAWQPIPNAALPQWVKVIHVYACSFS